MNSSPTRTFWLSIFMGVFAMFMIYSYSQEKKAEYDKKFGANKRVLVAAKDILEMSTIDDTMIETAEYPVDFIQPGAMETPEDAVNKVAAAPIKKGEQILTTKLLIPGPNTGLSMQVQPNKRAVTIPVDDIRGVGKLVRPGDSVDVITTLELSKGQNAKTEVKTLLQDVIVLAAGVNITNNIPRVLEGSNTAQPQFRNLNGDLSFSSITLEVTPKEAQDLIYIMASAPGSIYLSLRNPYDRSAPTLNPSTDATVLGRLDARVEDAQQRIPAQTIQTPQPIQVPIQRQLPRRAQPGPAKKKNPFVDIN